MRLAQALLAEALGLLEAHAVRPLRDPPGGIRAADPRAQAPQTLERWTEAADVLEDFRSRRAGHASAPAALRLLARARMAQREWTAARAVCAELESAHPDSPETPAAWLDLAAALGAAGQAADARRILERIETAYAGQAWGERAALGLLEWHVTQGDRAQALLRLDTLATNRNLLAETRAHGFQIVARALAAETSYSAALDMIEKGIAAAADPAQRLDTQLAKARILIEAGRAEEGAALMRSLAAGIPDKTRAARVQQDLAGQMARLEHWNEAAAECQVWLDAFEGEPGTAEILSNGGWALWKAGRHAEAADWFERAVAAETDSHRRLDLRQKLADARFAAGQFSQAQTVYAEVLAALPPGDPAAERVQYQLAETELALGETEAGEIRLLDLSRSPGGSEHVRAATMRLGVLYEERGALESAVDQYSRLLEAGPDPAPAAEALLARGLVRFRMGSFQAALDDFSRIRGEFPLTPPPPAPCSCAAGASICWAATTKPSGSAVFTTIRRSEFVPDAFLAGRACLQPRRSRTGRAAVRSSWPGSTSTARAPPTPCSGAGRAATARRAYLAANEHFNALMARYPDSSRLLRHCWRRAMSSANWASFPPPSCIQRGHRTLRSPEAMIAWAARATASGRPSGRESRALRGSLAVLPHPAGLRPRPIRACRPASGRLAASLEKWARRRRPRPRWKRPTPISRKTSPPRRPPSGSPGLAAAALQERAGTGRKLPVSTPRRRLGAGRRRGPRPHEPHPPRPLGAVLVGKGFSGSTVQGFRRKQPNSGTALLHQRATEGHRGEAGTAKR